MDAGETAFNPLRARGSAESAQEVGTSIPGCQMRKLRQASPPPSSEGQWTQRPPARAAPKHITTPTLASREGAKRAGRTGRRRVGIPEKGKGRSDPGPSLHLQGPPPASALPKPRHPPPPSTRADASRPRQSPLQRAAPRRCPSRTPSGARSERGGAARPPETIPRPAAERRASPPGLPPPRPSPPARDPGPGRGCSPLAGQAPVQPPRSTSGRS